MYGLWVNLRCHKTLAGQQWKWHMQAVVPRYVWPGQRLLKDAWGRKRPEDLKGKVSFSSVVPKSWKWIYSRLIYPQNSFQWLQSMFYQPLCYTPLSIALCSDQLFGQDVHPQKRIHSSMCYCGMYIWLIGNQEKIDQVAIRDHFSSTTWTFLEPYPLTWTRNILSPGNAWDA